MSADCLPHQVPSSASRFLKGIPAELLEHTCHMELLNKPTARRDTNGANFAQPPPRPPPAHGLPRAGGASDARLASQAAAGGAAALAAGAAALAAGLGSQLVGSQPAMREAISGSQAEGERPTGAVTGAVGAHLARWQQAHARKEHERRARKEKEQARKAEKEAANEAAAGEGEASGSRAPRAPKAAPKAPSSKAAGAVSGAVTGAVTGAVPGAVPSSKAAGKARVPPAGDPPPAKKAKSKRIVVDDEDSEDNDSLFD